VQTITQQPLTIAHQPLETLRYQHFAYFSQYVWYAFPQLFPSLVSTLAGGEAQRTPPNSTIFYEVELARIVRQSNLIKFYRIDICRDRAIGA